MICYGCELGGRVGALPRQQRSAPRMSVLQCTARAGADCALATWRRAADRHCCVLTPRMRNPYPHVIV